MKWYFEVLWKFYLLPPQFVPVLALLTLVEDRHVLQQDIDLGFERVNVNRYLGFDFEFGFSMLILVDVTIFTGSSGMKSCS